MSCVRRAITLCAIAATLSFGLHRAKAADADQVARGKYLVTFGGCTDCHTAGTFTTGKPDMNRFLGGSDFAFVIPGMGLFVARNITPDKETGIGNWTDEQIATALTQGKRPDGRTLAPAMPWRDIAVLNSEDVMSIIAYLRSIKPVHNEVPGPYGPNDKVSVYVSRMIPPDVYNAQLKPGAPAGKTQ